MTDPTRRAESVATNPPVGVDGGATLRICAAILAAGEGRRLRPLTRGLPKPLVPWLDGPMIDVARRSVREAGIECVGFNTCYADEAFMRWAGAESIDPRRISREAHLLGTGGGGRQIAATLGIAGRDDAILVTWNGDVVADPDLDGLIEDVRRGALASLLLREKAHDERGLAVRADGRQVLSLPDHDGEHWASAASEAREVDEVLGFTGILAVRASVFRGIEPSVELCTFRDILGPRLRDGASVRFRRYGGFFSDLGTPRRYFDGSREALESDFLGLVSRGVYRQRRDGDGVLWAHDDATVDPRARWSGHVICGPGARLEAGCHVRDAVIIGARVGGHCIEALRIGENEAPVPVA